MPLTQNTVFVFNFSLPNDQLSQGAEEIKESDTFHWSVLKGLKELFVARSGRINAFSSLVKSV